MAAPDNIEVFRKVHELNHTHGFTAYKYAAKSAAEALKEGNVEEHEFWKAVTDTLSARDRH